MKYCEIFFNALLLVALSHCSELNSNNIQWDNFKKTYNKIYDVEEDLTRFKIFVDNLKLIEENHNLFQKNQVSFKLDVNKFADLTSAEFRKTLTSTKSDRLNFRHINVTTPPESLNWTDLGAVTSVKDQGACGSGVAFAITGAYEGFHFVETNKVEASGQELSDCAYGCKGGLVEVGYAYVNILCCFCLCVS